METIEIDGGKYPDCRERQLTDDEMKKLYKENGDVVSAIVKVRLSSCIDHDWEWFWDLMSEKVTGSHVGLRDLKYEVVGGESIEFVLLRVDGILNLEDLGMVEDMTGKEIKSKQYIVDDRTGEINQIGPFEAEDIYEAVEMLLDGDFENFRKNIDTEIVDDEHGYIVINLPGGARYEYEVGEVGTEPATNAEHLEGAEQPEVENAERSRVDYEEEEV